MRATLITTLPIAMRAPFTAMAADREHAKQSLANKPLIIVRQ